MSDLKQAQFAMCAMFGSSTLKEHSANLHFNGFVGRY